MSNPSRRSFVKAGAAALAGVAAAGAPVPESLALSGGPKAVTIPNSRHLAAVKWPRYGPAEKQALHELIDSGRFYDELPRFEKAWQEYTKAPFVKAHCNGTSALTSLFFALDLPAGSEILAPSYTFFATTLPMRFFGCVPVFVDIHPRTACFDLEDAARKLTPRTRAVIPMHSWGLPCEMDHIAGFARKHGLIVLEDAAHAHGASMQGRAMGTWGAMGIYSFQTSKVLPAVEGGIGMYQTRDHYERAAAYGHYEDPPKFPNGSRYRDYVETGFGQKFRMHPFAAAVARRQLESLDERNALVHSQVRKLNERLLALPGISEPRCRPDQKRAYYYANMLFLDEARAGFSRDALLKALRAEGVRATTWIYPEQHKYKIYSEAKWWHHPPQIPKSLPGTDQVQRSHFFVPLFYAEAPDLVEQYVKAFEKVWAHRAELAKA
jgi:dTDP-4-amino-4,6-dideoxygalactose transaminase